MVKGVFPWWCLEGWTPQCQGTVNDRGSGYSQGDLPYHPSQGPGKPGSSSNNSLVQETRISHSPRMAGQGLGDGTGLGRAMAAPSWSSASYGSRTQVEFWPMSGLRRGPGRGWAGTGRAHVGAPWP